MPDSSVLTIFHVSVVLWVGVIISEIRELGPRKANWLTRDGAESGRVGIGTQVHETP